MKLFRKKRLSSERKPGLRTATEAQRWYPGYRERFRHDWLLIHGKPTETLRMPFWARGDDGIDAWVTDTPEWDRMWFKDNNMLLPRFINGSRTYWRDYGDGLRGLSYR